MIFLHAFQLTLLILLVSLISEHLRSVNFCVSITGIDTNDSNKSYKQSQKLTSQKALISDADESFSQNFLSQIGTAGMMVV